MEQLKIAIGIAAAMGNIAGKVFEDGKVSLVDVPQIYKLLPLLSQAKELDMEALKLEVKALKKEEVLALVEELKVELDIPQDKVEVIIEQGLEAVINLLCFLLSFKK